MGQDGYQRILFRALEPKDTAVLEKWYRMTDQLGYATGFKSFDEVKERIKNNSGHSSVISMILLENREEPVGFVYGELKMLNQANVLWIYLIIIDPAWQMQGIGTRAVNKLLRFAANHFNVSLCLITVAEKNSQGMRFWEKLGFLRSLPLEESLNTFGPAGIAIMKKSIKEA